MGLLDLIFGSKRKAGEISSRGSESGEDVTFMDNFIRISSIDFFGKFRKSPSGEWIVGWSDSNPEGSAGGHRQSGHGKYVLYNSVEKKLVLQGCLERPNSANVANNGSFSIEDWHFGSDLSGTFYVFSCLGDALVKKKLSANIMNSVISNNGLLAVCQTANAKSGSDGNLLIGFRVNDGHELFSINPCTGWAKAYEFDEDDSKFGVVLKGVGTFFYNSEGSLLDPQALDLARLRSDRYEVCLFASEEIVKSDQSSQELVEEALRASLKALASGAEAHDHWKAMALKVKGLANERLGKDEEALEAFDAALDINPKIGVKRNANAIRKRLNNRNS
ncbi:tetratricopeptide repeat protein [Halomonas sp. 25-S5]|uniref:tetratricopeptide repeat protein n=1 Tax=Halomonas sp. 25-S5 TaxID=2994065 RepID=UPI002468E775|nr:tetratricopeptide repeat protein [Halomonas sp. 25-S5]